MIESRTDTIMALTRSLSGTEVLRNENDTSNGTQGWHGRESVAIKDTKASACMMGRLSGASK